MKAFCLKPLTKQRQRAVGPIMTHQDICQSEWGPQMYVCLACAAHAGERRSFKSQSLLSVNAQCERLGIKLPCSSLALLLIPNIIKTNSYKLFFEKDAKEKNCFYDTRWNKTKSCCRFTRRHFTCCKKLCPEGQRLSTRGSMLARHTYYSAQPMSQKRFSRAATPGLSSYRCHTTYKDILMVSRDHQSKGLIQI